MKNKLVGLNKNDIRKIVESKLKKLITKSKYFDIDNLSNNELNWIKSNLEGICQSSCFGGPFMEIDGNIIAEQAKVTMSPEDVRSEMIKKFRLKEYQIIITTYANHIRIVILTSINQKNVRLIIKAMDACGWSIATRRPVRNDKGEMFMELSFDPIFQNDESTIIRSAKFLYHWIPYYHFDSIITNGLEPRSENDLFEYPPKIHILKGNIPSDEVYNIGKSLCMVNNKEQNDGRYVLLSIDLSKVPNDVEFYYDPRYEYGCYAKKKIDAQALNPIYGYNFKTDEYFVPKIKEPQQ